jgi:hypothetical protein
VIEAEGLDSAVESAIEVISKRVLASRGEAKLELAKVKS